MKRFDSLAGLITDNARYVIGLFVVLSMVVAAGAPAVEQSTSMENFQPDNAEADALDRIEGTYTGEENTSVAQVIVRDDDVLDRETLLAMFRYERALLANDTVNGTLVDEEPIVGVHDLIATGAIRQEIAANLSSALGEFRRLNASVTRQRAALQRNRTAIQRRSDALNATTERLRSALTALQEDPDADVDAAFDRVRNASEVRLDAEDRETFRKAAESLRDAETETEAERAYRRGTRGVLAEEYDALQQRRDQLERRREQLETDVERLEQLGDTVRELKAALEAAGDPSLERKVQQLRSMNDSEIQAVVEEVLAEDGPRSGRALLFMPRDFEPGTTEANATVLLVTHRAESGASPASAPERMIDAQTAMRTIGAEQSGAATYTVFGDGILADEIDTSMQDSILLVAPMALLFVLAVLTLAYRDLLDVVLGLAGVGLVLAWTFGFMGWMGIDFGQVFIMVPVLLIGLSIDFGIHVFMRYREERGDEAPRAEVRDAMRAALAGLGIALAFVTVTTAVGFLSNLASPAPPIQKIGLVSAWGIVAALLVFGTFVPAVKQELDAMLESRGIDRHRSAVGTGDGSLSRLLEVGSWGARRAPLAVIVGALLISAAGGYGATGIDSSFENSDFLAEDPADWVEDLPEPFAPAEYTARDTIDLLNDRFVRQDRQAQVLVEGAVTSDDAMDRVAAGQQVAANSSVVATGPGGEPTVESPVTVMREVAATNESFNATFTAADTDGDRVPDRNIEAVYDELFRVAPDRADDVIERSSDGEYESLRVVVRVDGEAAGGDVIDQMDAVESAVQGDGLTATATGQVILNKQTQDNLVTSVLDSLAVTLVAVLLLLAGVYRYTEGSATLGAVTVLPVVFVLALVAGTMYLLGISINVATALLTSLTIGLGIDHSIHVSERYVQELQDTSHVGDALDRTLRGTGGALLGSAATTVGGFGVLLAALLPPLRQLGLIAGASIGYSFLAAVLVLPSLLVVWTRYAAPAELREGRREGDPSTAEAEEHPRMATRGPTTNGSNPTSAPAPDETDVVPDPETSWQDSGFVPATEPDPGGDGVLVRRAVSDRYVAQGQRVEVELELAAPQGRCVLKEQVDTGGISSVAVHPRADVVEQVTDGTTLYVALADERSSSDRTRVTYEVRVPQSVADGRTIGLEGSVLTPARELRIGGVRKVEVVADLFERVTVSNGVSNADLGVASEAFTDGDLPRRQVEHLFGAWVTEEDASQSAEMHRR